jgi:purine-nucleoside phosphorylase
MDREKERSAAQSLSAIARPGTAVILGTGLGVMEGSIAVKETIPYRDIPGFPVSSVMGHSGRLLFGTLGGTEVVVMSGRFHLYEGYSPREVTFPIRVFARMGVRQILISNAAGGLAKDLIPGTPMLITDHINLTGLNPLTGPNDEELGPRFPGMTEPYSKNLQARARRVASGLGIGFKEGVYVQVPGPSLETAAETRMLQILRADAVGMSTVLEVIQAVHCGMEVLAVSAITNVNDPNNYHPTTIEEVIAMAEKAGPAIAQIFSGVLGS